MAAASSLAGRTFVLHRGRSALHRRLGRAAPGGGSGERTAHSPVPPDLSEKMSAVSSHVPDQLLSVQEKETFT